MAKKGGSPPPAPDPAATAAAQGQLNREAVRESALVNQINQNTPYGNISFTGGIGTPGRTQTLTLPGQAQTILDRERDVALGLTNFARDYVPRISESLAQPFDTADLGPAPVANEAERQRIENALLGRLEPQFQRDEARLETRLANQGLARGSEAFGNAFEDFNQVRTDARLATIGQAGAEYARDFGLQNQNYQQRLSNALLNRTQGLNEVSALLQGAPAIAQPSLPQAAQYQVAPGDFQGASALNYQGALNAYNSRISQQNALFGGLAGLGGSLGSAAILAPAFG